MIPLTIPQFDAANHFTWSDTDKDMKFLGWMLDERDTSFRIDTREQPQQLRFGQIDDSTRILPGNPYTVRTGILDPTHPDVIARNSKMPRPCRLCPSGVKQYPIHCHTCFEEDEDYEKEFNTRLSKLQYQRQTAAPHFAELRCVDGECLGGAHNNCTKIYVRTVKFYASWAFGEIQITYLDGLGEELINEVFQQDGYLINPDRTAIGPDYRLSVPGIRFNMHGHTPNNDYMTYGIMVADETVMQDLVVAKSLVGQSFGGWRVVRGPSDQIGEIYFPGEYLDGLINDSIEFEAVWYEWHAQNTLGQGSTGLINNTSTVQATCFSGNIDTGVLVLPGGSPTPSWNGEALNITNSNIHTVIVPYMPGGTLFRDRMIGHSVERILIPSLGTITLEEQSIHSASLAQLYVGDNLTLNQGNPVAGRASVMHEEGGLINIESSMIGFRVRQGAMKITTCDDNQIIPNPITGEKVRFSRVGDDPYSDDEEHINFIRGGNRSIRRTTKYFYDTMPNPTGALYLHTSGNNHELIAYPGAADTVLVSSEIAVTTVRSYAFAYMAELTEASVLSLATSAVTNVRARAIFHSTAEQITLPSVGTVHQTAISGYQPELRDVRFGMGNATSAGTGPSPIGHFVDGILYRTDSLTHIMYMTRSVTQVGGIVIIPNAVNNINEYALSSFYAGIGGTAINHLAINTHNVAIQLIHFQNDHTNTLLHENRGQQTYRLTRLSLGGTTQSIDHRIFSGPNDKNNHWTIQDVRINSENIALTNRQTTDLRSFPIFVGADLPQAGAENMLNHYMGFHGTTWGNIRAENNPRIQTRGKRVVFNAGGGTGSMADDVTNRFHEEFTVPSNRFTAPAGSVFIGWRVSTPSNRPSHMVSDHLTNQTIYQPGWEYNVQMKNTLLATNSVGAWDEENWTQEEEAGLYIQDVITLTAVWARSKIQFIDRGTNITQRLIDNTSDLQTDKHHRTILVHETATSFRPLPAHGFELAHKELDDRGVPIDVETPTLTFALVGTNIGFTDGGENLSFVGWTSRNPSDVNHRWSNNTPDHVRNRFIPDGRTAGVQLSLPPAEGAELTFHTLFDLSSGSNVTYTAHEDVNARARVTSRTANGNIRIPAAIMDTAGHISGVPTQPQFVNDAIEQRQLGFMRRITVIDGPNAAGVGGFVNMTGTRTSIYIGGSVTTIQPHAFRGSRSTTELLFGHNWLSEGATPHHTPSLTIGDYAFADFARLPTVTLPLAVTSIGNYAFVHNLALTTVAMEQHDRGAQFATENSRLATIGDYVFWSNRSMTTLFELPSGVTAIGEGAFELTRISAFVSENRNSAAAGNGRFFTHGGHLYFRETASIIYLFKYAPGMPIGDGIIGVGLFNHASVNATRIATGAFAASRNIRFLTIPSTVTHIDEGAFRYSYEILEWVTFSVGGSPANIDPDAFRNTTITVRVPSGQVGAYQSHLNLPASRVIAI